MKFPFKQSVRLAQIFCFFFIIGLIVGCSETQQLPKPLPEETSAKTANASRSLKKETRKGARKFDSTSLSFSEDLLSILIRQVDLNYGKGGAISVSIDGNFKNISKVPLKIASARILARTKTISREYNPKFKQDLLPDQSASYRFENLVLSEKNIFQSVDEIQLELIFSTNELAAKKIAVYPFLAPEVQIVPKKAISADRLILKETIQIKNPNSFRLEFGGAALIGSANGYKINDLIPDQNKIIAPKGQIEFVHEETVNLLDLHDSAADILKRPEVSLQLEHSFVFPFARVKKTVNETYPGASMIVPLFESSPEE